MTRQALVTGGAARIGKSIALALAQAGFDIALHYNKSKTHAQNTADAITDSGRRCELFQADFCINKEPEHMMNRVLTQFPDLSVVVNSASMFVKNSIATSTISDVQQNFLLHLFAPFSIIQCFTKSQKSGVVINIVDTKIAQNTFSYAGYLLSKKALAELTRMAALEYAPHFRIHGIAPGHVLPPIDGTTYSPHPETLNPLKKIISLESITDTIMYLIHTKDSTGQIIFVDGGEHIQWH